MHHGVFRTRQRRLGHGALGEGRRRRSLLHLHIAASGCRRRLLLDLHWLWSRRCHDCRNAAARRRHDAASHQQVPSARRGSLDRPTGGAGREGAAPGGALGGSDMGERERCSGAGHCRRQQRCSCDLLRPMHADGPSQDRSGALSKCAPMPRRSPLAPAANHSKCFQCTWISLRHPAFTLPLAREPARQATRLPGHFARFWFSAATPDSCHMRLQARWPAAASRPAAAAAAAAAAATASLPPSSFASGSGLLLHRKAQQRRIGRQLGLVTEARDGKKRRKPQQSGSRDGSSSSDEVRRLCRSPLGDSGAPAHQPPTACVVLCARACWLLNIWVLAAESAGLVQHSNLQAVHRLPRCCAALQELLAPARAPYRVDPTNGVNVKFQIKSALMLFCSASLLVSLPAAVRRCLEWSRAALPSVPAAFWSCFSSAARRPAPR